MGLKENIKKYRLACDLTLDDVAKVVGTTRQTIQKYESVDCIEGYAFADVGDDEDYFYLRVSGDSMINAFIFENDLVLVEKQSVAENGQIVVCQVNGDEATIKRYRRQGSTVILQPENPAYEPIIVPIREFEVGYARIVGVVREVKRKI
jgi:repressor LexA